MTSEQLIASIKRRSKTPTAESAGLTQVDYLALADEEMLSVIFPKIRSTVGNYFVQSVDTQTVANQDRYRLPARAGGAKVREVWLLDSAGNKFDIGDMYLENAASYYTTVGQPSRYYIQENNIVLVPTPSDSSWTIRVFYYLRPSALVLSTAVTTVLSINLSTKTLTTVAYPDTFLASTPLDIVKVSSPFEVTLASSLPTLTAPNLIQFASLPNSIAVGDFVCLAEQTPVIQLPLDLHPWLAQRTAVAVLEAEGDQLATLARKKLSEIEEGVMAMISPRNDGESKVLGENSIFDAVASWGNWGK